MAPDQSNRLPFEPGKKRPKEAKGKAKSAAPAKKQPQQSRNLPGTSASGGAAAKDFPQKPELEKVQKSKEEMAIPKVVSSRMAKRMALFCGVPTALGILSFVASYIAVNHGFKLPNIAVLLVSMGFFGLGVLGLSYGVLSASWDEEILGSKLGWQEFTTNWGRMVSVWRSTRQKNISG